MRQLHALFHHRSRRGVVLGLALLVAALVFTNMPAQAQSLDALRSSGQVAERYDGLVVARSNDPAVRAAVDKINAERQKIYAKQAAKQGVPVDQVGRVFAGQILGSAPAGTYFVQENGKIVQK